MRQRSAMILFAAYFVSKPWLRMSTFTRDRRRFSSSDGLLIWSRKVMLMGGTRPCFFRSLTKPCVGLRRK